MLSIYGFTSKVFGNSVNFDPIEKDGVIVWQSAIHVGNDTTVICVDESIAQVMKETAKFFQS
jgi:hypothetical protein